MNEELKPCPFCGGVRLNICTNCIECEECHGQLINDDSEEDLYEAWNRRV